MTTYRAWLDLATAGAGWLRRTWSERYFGHAALLADLVAEGATEAVAARFPSYAAPDSLLEIGLGRRLRRYVSMTPAQWRDWVKQAWSQHRQHGSPQAVERALASFSAVGVVVESQWARFWIALTSVPVTVGPAPKYNDGFLYGDGTLYGVTGDPVAIGVVSRDIRNAALDWKRACSRYEFAAIGTGGASLYGAGWTYGDGTLYGGDAAYL